MTSDAQITAKKPTRIVGYLRVSTREQLGGGGLDIQKNAVQTWAKANDARVVRWCRDEGVSGTKPPAERPGLLDALDAIFHREADAVVVGHLDRIARTLTIQEAVLTHVWKHGGAVYSAATGEIQQDDPKDPMRTFVRQVMGAAAQLEREMITARLRIGRQHKADQGGFAFGSPPYGWTSVDKALVEIPSEQATLKVMNELRLGGASYRTIVQALTDGGHKPKRGGTWSPPVVRHILLRGTPNCVKA